MFSIQEEIRKLPFLKLLIPFIFGCLAGCYFPEKWIIATLFAAILLIILIVLSASKLSAIFHLSYLWSISLLGFLFFAGFTFSGYKLIKYQLPNEALASKNVIAKVIDIPVKVGAQSRFTAQVLYYNNNSWLVTNFNCRITIDTSAMDIQPGDVYLIKAPIKEIPLPVAPFQFDYRKYSYFHGIVGQIRVKPENVKKLFYYKNLWYKLLLFRSNLVHRLTNYNFKNDEKAVLSSMVLGYESELSSDLRNAYANAGVLHILSVSGMHVGIVYYFLLVIFFFLKGNRKIEIARSILIILALWFYALIAGFSAPVIRSAAMFSFFAMGVVFNRSGNPFNTLAASALGILLFDPLQILDIGFQLSYAAMAGIFLCYEKINNWNNSSNRYFSWVWKLIAVSIAATIGTVPLSLYYFHQFPTFFIITNLLIVPLSSVVLYGGIILLIFSFIPFVYPYFAWLLDKTIYFLNLLVYKSESIPFSAIHNISIDKITVVCVYLLTLIFILWLEFKNQRWLYLLLGLILILTINSSTHSIKTEKQREIIFYNTTQPSFSVINGKTMVTIVDSIEMEGLKKASGNLKLKCNIINSEYVNLNQHYVLKDTIIDGLQMHQISNQGVYFKFKNVTILFVSSNCRRFLNLNRNLKFDYILLSKSQKIFLNQYVESKKVQFIYFGKSDKYLDSLRNAGIYFTGLSGSFVREL